jgi:hypothetical protein
VRQLVPTQKPQMVLGIPSSTFARSIANADRLQAAGRTGINLDDAHCLAFRLFDLGAIASWHLNVMDRAVERGRKAIELDPANQRLKNNLDFFIKRREEVRAGA